MQLYFVTVLKCLVHTWQIHYLLNTFNLHTSGSDSSQGRMKIKSIHSRCLNHILQLTAIQKVSFGIDYWKIMQIFLYN